MQLTSCSEAIGGLKCHGPMSASSGTGDANLGNGQRLQVRMLSGDCVMAMAREESLQLSAAEPCIHTGPVS